MLIVKSPFRISYFGGGTDFPVWFNNHDKGMVLSTTINKYCYILTRTLPPFFSFNYRLRYYDTELVKNIRSIKHPVIKCVLHKFYKKKGGLEIIHCADLPALSGLGASSAFTTSMIKSIFAINNLDISKKGLAEKSTTIENDILKEYGGYQDQYAAAYGGFNEITFQKKNVHVKVLNINEEKKKILEKNTLIFFTGVSRRANMIEKDKIAKFSKNIDYYKEILDICKEAKSIFLNNDKSKFLFDIANLMNLSWDLKKKLSPNVSNNFINQIYERGIKNGALAGKILGAGGGGFIMFLTKNNNDKKKLINHFNKFKYVEVKFEKKGTEIIQKGYDEYL
jgi:D-glycero-alpha-D-manno-heptose-7-phosphate kinase